VSAALLFAMDHPILWILSIVLIAVILTLEVHWLLVRADYRDYKACGGTRGLWAFHRARGRLKNAFRRQQIAVHEHRAPDTPPPSLGRHVYEQENSARPPA